MMATGTAVAFRLSGSGTTEHKPFSSGDNTQALSPLEYGRRLSMNVTWSPFSNFANFLTPWSRVDDA